MIVLGRRELCTEAAQQDLSHHQTALPSLPDHTLSMNWLSFLSCRASFWWRSHSTPSGPVQVGSKARGSDSREALSGKRGPLNINVMGQCKPCDLSKDEKQLLTCGQGRSAALCRWNRGTAKAAITGITLSDTWGNKNESKRERRECRL